METYKSIANKETKLDINVKRLFLSNKNLRRISVTLYNLGVKVGNDLDYEALRHSVNKRAIQFVKSEQVSYPIEYYTTEVYDWIEHLAIMNAMFAKKCYGLLKWNVFLPTRNTSLVGTAGNKKRIKYKDMYADDYKTLNVWKTQEVQVTPDRFRDGNKIPFYQRTMHTRHYDTGNDGLHATPNRASLDSIQRGFNMDRIFYKGSGGILDKWQSEEWFGM